MPVLGLEPRISDVGNDISTECATPIANYWFGVTLRKRGRFWLFTKNKFVHVLEMNVYKWQKQFKAIISDAQFILGSTAHEHILATGHFNGEIR